MGQVFPCSIEFYVESLNESLLYQLLTAMIGLKKKLQIGLFGIRQEFLFCLNNLGFKNKQKSIQCVDHYAKDWKNTIKQF